MNKEQIKEQIESIFNTPKAWEMVKNIYGNVTVDEQILKVDYIIDQIVTLTQQHEANALKEQRERIQDKIDKSYLYLRSLCLAPEDDGDLARGYDLAMNEALSQLAALKAELEERNERD